MRYRGTSLVISALLASAGSLALAFVAQYGYGLAPCELCLAQRVPYALAILVALAGLVHATKRLRYVAVLALLFAVGGAIATYHTLVEQHMVAGPTGCTSQPSPAGQTLDQLLEKIKHAPVTACDQPAWSYHGVTMAALNAAWSWLLALAMTLGGFSARKRRS